MLIFLWERFLVMHVLFFCSTCVQYSVIKEKFHYIKCISTAMFIESKKMMLYIKRILLRHFFTNNEPTKV